MKSVVSSLPFEVKHVENYKIIKALGFCIHWKVPPDTVLCFCLLYFCSFCLLILILTLLPRNVVFDNSYRNKNKQWQARATVQGDMHCYSWLGAVRHQNERDPSEKEAKEQVVSSANPWVRCLWIPEHCDKALTCSLISSFSARVKKAGWPSENS